jgi:plastocyanin
MRAILLLSTALLVASTPDLKVGPPLMRTSDLTVGPAPSTASASQASGTIRGRVEIAQPVAPLERRPGVADLGPGPRTSVDRRRSVVYLESGPRGAFDDRAEQTRATLDQRDETFVPHVLAVMAGTTVDFPNNDRTYHNVFSLSKARTFDLGRYPNGRSKAIRFSRPGIVRVFCDIHSHMSAFILVFGHPHFATTDADGRYRIDNLPAGSYTIAVWNEALQRDALQGQSRRVTVGDGADVEVNFTLGSREPSSPGPPDR